MKSNDEAVGVYWKDMFVYSDGATHALSSLYTEGILFKKDKKYIVIKDPVTISVHGSSVKNHPPHNPCWYYIPMSLVQDILFL